MLSPDNSEKLEAMREKLGLDFPVLVDSELSVTASYGLVNPKSPEVPHPAVLLIDQEGNVAWMRVDENYVVRPPVEELQAALADLGGSS